MADFEFIEHTADMAVRVYASDMKEVFRNTAEVMFSILVEGVEDTSGTIELDLQAETWGELLISWLNELLSIFSAYSFLPNSYDIKLIDERHSKVIKAFMRGCNYVKNKCIIKTEIKAATYHSLKIQHDKEGKYTVEILFDV